MFAALKRVCPNSIESIGNYLHRNLSQAMFRTLTFSEVNEKMKKTDTFVLDVREVAELKSDGKIPTSNNIPVGEVAEAIKLNATDFKNKYGFVKPDVTAPIVIHCKAGVRAANAAKIMAESGYSNIEVYPGILDWVGNGGKLER